VERAIDEAFVSGYRVVMLVATASALASALGATLLIEGKRNRKSSPTSRRRRSWTPEKFASRRCGWRQWKMLL
jgi:hypothetical protein